MTSSNTLKKIISLGASLLLAVGGSLVAAQPASANVITATPVLQTGVPGAHIQAGLQYLSLSLTGCSLTGTPSLSDFNLTNVGGTQTLAAVTRGGYLSLQLSSVLVGGEHLTITYTPSGTPLGCGGGDTLGAFTFDDTAPVAAPISTVAPVITGTTSVGSTVTVNTGTWTGSPSSYTYQWVLREPFQGNCGASNTVSNISGATTNSYTLTSSERNKCLSVKVYAVNAGGTSSAAIPTYSLVNAATPTFTGTATVGSTLTVASAGFDSLWGGWWICTSSHASNSQPGMDCREAATVNNRTVNTQSFVIPATYNNGTSTVGLYISYVNGQGYMAATAQIAAAGTITTTDSTDVTDPVTEDKRPLPVWASNIVKSIPTLTKSLNTTGGAVALTDGDYADLKSVTIGGKAVTFKIESTGNVSIPVPAGQAGKTADIVIVFAGGTMTVQDGIKYVAQTDVATVVERPIAIAAGAKKLTEAVADQIRQAAFANMTNTTVQCVAYASKNTVAAKAAAKLTAIQACGIAAAANPALKVSEVSVIVNKAKAKKQAVGIKVYK